MKRTRRMCFGWLVCLFAVGVLVVSGGSNALAADEFACVADDKLERNIAEGAELVQFVCFFDTYEGKNVLHFKVGVKNTSDKEQRFRVNIFLDNGKAVGGLIPDKTKSGLVKPGETGSFVYPVTGMTEKPGEVMLKISPIAS
jgi:hypothetical protein